MIHDLANENDLYSHTGKVEENNKYVLLSKEEISNDILNMLESDIEMKYLIKSMRYIVIIIFFNRFGRE